jgi:hypothetical protein
MVMKVDSRSLWPAEVEVLKVKFSKSADLGIDFSNEIDAWAKMEFKFRKQIKQLKHSGVSYHAVSERDELKTLRYAFREKLEE